LIVGNGLENVWPMSSSVARFSIFVTLVLSMLLASIYTAIGFYQGRFILIWPLKYLRFSTHMVVRILPVPILNTLFTSIRVDGGVMQGVAGVSLFVLVTFGTVVRAVHHNNNPTSRAFDARSSTVVDVLVWVSKCVFSAYIQLNVLPDDQTDYPRASDIW
jgi:hypothetical protein